MTPSACPACGGRAVSLGAFLQHGGARFVCASCGAGLVRSVWLVPIQVAGGLLFFAALLFTAASGFRSALPVFLVLVPTAVVAIVGARWLTWRYVPVRMAPAGPGWGHRAATATAPAIIVGGWVLLWSHEQPLLAGAIAFGLVWMVAVLTGARRSSY